MSTLPEATALATYSQVVAELVQDTRFAWLESIAQKPTELALAEGLVNPRDLPDRFPPLALHRNISLANDIANRCLSKRDQIIDLEAKALNSAISLNEELTSLDTSLHLAKARMRGTAVQLSPSELEDAINNIEEQHKAIERSIRHRLELHNIRASPLNYGEQLTFQRQLHIENCQTLSELLWSIYSGLISCYPSAQKTIEPPPFPYVPYDSLQNWVIWLRFAVRTLESLEYNEHVRTAHIPLLRTRAMQGFDLSETYQTFLTDGTIDVEITREAFAVAGITLYPETRPRLLGVSIAIVPLALAWLNTNQTDAAFASNVLLQNVMTDVAQLKYPCLLVAPDQSHFTPTLQHDLGVQSVSDPGLGVAALTPKSAGPIEYFNPLGSWSVRFSPDIRLLPSKAILGSLMGMGDLHSMLSDVPGQGPLRFEVFLNLAVSISTP